MFTTDEGKRFLRFARVGIIILSIFLLAYTITALKSWNYIGRDIAQNNVISVNGEGEVFSVPDVATFSFGVTADAKTVTEAQDKSTEKIGVALKLVKDAGVLDKDIKTTDYSVYPKYEYTNGVCTQYTCPPQKQNLVGYTVNQTITVKVRKVEDAGKILGSLGTAQVTNLSGLQFTVDDETKLQNDARAKAIADAKDKAKILARDLGVSLSRIVSFSETGNYPTPYYARDMVAMESANGKGVATPQIPTGENKVVSNVTITYEIR